MKKAALFMVLFFLINGGVFAQESNDKDFASEKGEIDFGFGGLISTANKNGLARKNSLTTTISDVFIGYFPSDKLRVDAGFSVHKEDTYANIDDAPLIHLMIGGRYFFWSRDKMRLNSGINFTFGINKGTKEADDGNPPKKVLPMTLKVPLELQYWPMEGGALRGGLLYEIHGLNLGKEGINKLGFEFGIMIRLK